jgi:hypothetical protein
MYSIVSIGRASAFMMPCLDTSIERPLGFGAVFFCEKISAWKAPLEGGGNLLL